MRYTGQRDASSERNRTRLAAKHCGNGSETVAVLYQVVFPRSRGFAALRSKANFSKNSEKGLRHSPTRRNKTRAPTRRRHTSSPLSLFPFPDSGILGPVSRPRHTSRSLRVTSSSLALPHVLPLDLAFSAMLSRTMRKRREKPPFLLHLSRSPRDRMRSTSGPKSRIKEERLYARLLLILNI